MGEVKRKRDGREKMGKWDGINSVFEPKPPDS
jgi:hypothetical protein